MQVPGQSAQGLPDKRSDSGSATMGPVNKSFDFINNTVSKSCEYEDSLRKRPAHSHLNQTLLKLVKTTNTNTVSFVYRNSYRTLRSSTWQREMWAVQVSMEGSRIITLTMLRPVWSSKLINNCWIRALTASRAHRAPLVLPNISLTNYICDRWSNRWIICVAWKLPKFSRIQIISPRLQTRALLSQVLTIRWASVIMVLEITSCDLCLKGVDMYSNSSPAAVALPPNVKLSSNLLRHNK